jgi:NTP pyrophosphatase (non-canonical NTP hydrolase)
MDLRQYQKLVRKLVKERGFDGETIPDVFMLFLEEAGEFAKAARKTSGIKQDDKSKQFVLEEEAADVFWLLVDLCNRLDIDLAKAFEEKEKVNQKRKWK